MQIDFLGGNCLILKTPHGRLVFDDNLADLGLKSITKPDDVLCLTNGQLIKKRPAARLLFDNPGAYEVGELMISGIQASAYSDDNQISTIYRVVVYSNGLSLLVLGHIQPKLDDGQLAEIGQVDVLAVPVGGGNSLNAQQASQLTHQIGPKLVLPTHYRQPGLDLGTDIDSRDKFIQELGAETLSAGKNLKLSPKSLPEALTIAVLG